MDRVYFHIDRIGVGAMLKHNGSRFSKSPYAPLNEENAPCANGALITEDYRGDLDDWDPKSNGTRYRHDVIVRDPWCVTDLLLTMKSEDVSSIRKNAWLRTTLPVNFAGVKWPYPVSAFSSNYCGLGGALHTDCQYILKNKGVRIAFPTILTKMFPEWASCNFDYEGIDDPVRTIDPVNIHGPEDLAGPIIPHSTTSTRINSPLRSTHGLSSSQHFSQDMPKLAENSLLGTAQALPGQSANNLLGFLPRATARPVDKDDDEHVLSFPSTIPGGSQSSVSSGSKSRPQMATFIDKNGAPVVVWGFEGGTFNVGGQLISHDASPARLLDGTTVSIDLDRGLSIDWKALSFNEALTGAPGVNFVAPSGSRMTAVLNDDGSYTIGDIIVDPGSKVMLGSGISVFVGVAGQLVVDSQTIQPSIMREPVGQSSKVLKPSAVVLGGDSNNKYPSSGSNDSATVGVNNQPQASRKSGGFGIRPDLFMACLSVCIGCISCLL
ncbi:hypothetical protein BT63DRAFT_110297 [Microthyrium microscopicum]|uniref:Uncharacterized protein n=1 Tax=Microthyrium microscopicum TaxID=703497 RepID=A0A6A6TX21_9PEZI|nr:hypothetical protein BT63DRAFT_110297 [Microthyrium microscopicum]